ncbi:radical SAM protein [Bacillus toyonensis]|uniref:radical SAM protein n=1 Tax=Bacillus toyonensis TaxID=155322 RepID=UPI003D19B9F0
MYKNSSKKIFGPIPTHKTLSIMPTYRCTAECNHCGTLSSPREKARLKLSDIIRIIDEAADAEYTSIVFTGGEATLVGADLLQAIKHAVARGLGTRLVTNAHWANSNRSSERKIKSLITAGLNEINYSTGDQHVRFVPFENILRAIKAAVNAGLRVSVMVETVAERGITKESITQHPIYQSIVTSHPNVKIDIHESPWMPLDPKQSHNYSEGMATNRNNLEGRVGCDSILSTTTIQADGRLASCCGLGMRLIPELQLGHISNTTIKEADEIAETDFLKRWLRVEGPEQIIAWAAEYNPNIKWEDMYAHRCQACIRLYQDPLIHEVIVQHYEEKIPDILFSEWLLHHYPMNEIS